MEHPRHIRFGMERGPARRARVRGRADAPRFTDRVDAGEVLALALAGHLSPDTVVLALPRGGVPVAAVIARRMGLPLDLCLVRKIGVPGDPELAVGAVAGPEGETTQVNEAVARRCGLSEDAIERLAGPVRDELRRRRALFLGDRAPVPLAGRTVLLVDDGAATGATMRAAIAATRAEGARRVIVAVPVAASEALAALLAAADGVHCLEAPADFSSVGEHYENFAQVPDEAVRRMLDAVYAA